MSSTPDWGHDDHAAPQSTSISILAVIAWIAGIAVMADCLYLAQRFLG